MNHQKPQCTIFADASMYEKERVAGYGCWIISDHKRADCFGGKSIWDKDSSVSELYALLEALKTAIHEGFITEATKAIVLQSDSLGALSVLRNHRKTWAVKSRTDKDSNIRLQKIKDPYWLFDSLFERFDIVYLKHVKGHSSGSSRNDINARCDRLAKQAARAQFAGKQPDLRMFSFDK